MNIEKEYLQLLKEILEQGEDHQDRTGVGTKSLFGCQISHHFEEGFPLLTTKKLPFRWVVEELKWFLSGSTRESDLRREGVDIWKEWATKEQCAKFDRIEGDLGPVYGSLWRRFPVGITEDDKNVDGNCHVPNGYVDQIQQLLDDIQNSPNSRRLIVSGWHPYYQKRVALPPCHTLWQIKCHGSSEISLHLYARSIDSFLGLPFNIASYGLLVSLLGLVTGRKPRLLVISFGDVHIYNNHTEQVKEQLGRQPRKLPILELEKTGDGIDDFDYELLRYDPYPAIKAEVAV